MGINPFKKKEEIAHNPYGGSAPVEGTRLKKPKYKRTQDGAKAYAEELNQGDEPTAEQHQEDSSRNRLIY